MSECAAEAAWARRVAPSRAHRELRLRQRARWSVIAGSAAARAKRTHGTWPRRDTGQEGEGCVDDGSSAFSCAGGVRSAQTSRAASSCCSTLVREDTPLTLAIPFAAFRGSVSAFAGRAAHEVSGRRGQGVMRYSKTSSAHVPMSSQSRGGRTRLPCKGASVRIRRCLR